MWRSHPRTRMLLFSWSLLGVWQYATAVHATTGTLHRFRVPAESSKAVATGSLRASCLVDDLESPSLLDVTNLSMPPAVEHLFDAWATMVALKLVDGGSSPPGVGNVAHGARGGSGLQVCPQLPRLTCMPLCSVVTWIVFHRAR